MERDAIMDAIRDELHVAALSRGDGNEGRARVCARRAAGLAVGWYAHQHGWDLTESNAYRRLLWLQSQMSVSEDLRQAAQRLTTRVTPDHQLPHPEDPLQDAELLISGMGLDLTGSQ